MGFLNIFGEAEINTISKTWDNWIPIIREKYGKNKYSKVKGFSNILDETEILTIPKVWEKLIPIARKNM